MIDQIRSDLYRFKRQRSTWVLLIVCAVFMLFSGFTYGIVLGDADWLQLFYNELGKTYAEYGIENPLTSIKALLGNGASSAAEFVTVVMNTDIAMIAVIFVAFFVVSMKSTGFIKNIAFMHKRSDFFFSNALVLLIYSFMLVLVAAVMSFLSSILFFRKAFLGNAAQFAVFLVGFALLVWTTALTASTLCSTMKKPVFGVVIACLYTSMGSSVFYMVIDELLKGLLGSGFKIEYLTPIGNMSLLSIGNYNTFLSAVIVTVIYFVCNLLTEVVLLKNKDFN